MDTYLRNYLVVTGGYWAFTVTDGAIRMLVVLYFHTLGYSPFEVAMLFLFYEFFGVVTNLVGGWLAARLGLNVTMHLGMAMQMTNICRDVAEDWERQRLYVPDELLATCGCPQLASELGSTFPSTARAPMARAIAGLLAEADRYYASGDAGLRALSWRCALAIRTARAVYSAIGTRIRRSGCDPLAGRAIVPGVEKLRLTFGAVLRSVADVPRRAATAPGSRPRPPQNVVAFPRDVLPI